MLKKSSLPYNKRKAKTLKKQMLFILRPFRFSLFEIRKAIIGERKKRIYLTRQALTLWQKANFKFLLCEFQLKNPALSNCGLITIFPFLFIKPYFPPSLILASPS